MEALGWTRAGRLASRMIATPPQSSAAAARHRRIARFASKISCLRYRRGFLTGGYPVSMVRAASGVAEKPGNFLHLRVSQSWALATGIPVLDPPTKRLSLRGGGALANGSTASERAGRRTRMKLRDRGPTAQVLAAAFGFRPSLSGACSSELWWAGCSIAGFTSRRGG